jgi:hypothetical protein
VDIFGQTPLNGRVRWVATSIFGDPNDLALLINSFFPFILICIYDKKLSSWKRILMTITGAVFILTIYYTDSRGGFIALSVVLAFFAYKEWGLLKACIVAGGLFVVLLFGHLVVWLFG